MTYKKDFSNWTLFTSFYIEKCCDLNTDKCWTEVTNKRNRFVVYWIEKNNRKEGV